MTQTITVLGGTGKTGSRVVRQLQELGRPVRAAARRAATRFDWMDDSAWAEALTEASAVYVVANEAPGGVDQLARFSSRAVQAGVGKLVLLSAREWVDIDYREGLEREQIVKESGAGWTILRPVWFAQNFSEEAFLADGITAGELVFGTGAGRHPFIDAEDIAAVAVAALTGEGHRSQTYELSGPRALTVPEAIEIIAGELKRTIHGYDATAPEYRAHLVEHYQSEDAADASLAMFELIRSGRDERLSDGVQRALGRPPRDFADQVRDAVAAGAWTMR